MEHGVTAFARYGALGIEAIGVAIIVAACLDALARSAWSWASTRPRHAAPSEAYHLLRQRLGRGILLGLEFLVAADIIHTVAVELTFETVAVLAIVVAVRTFLSFTMHVELTGRWPWQQPKAGHGEG